MKHTKGIIKESSDKNELISIQEELKIGGYNSYIEPNHKFSFDIQLGIYHKYENYILIRTS